MWLFLHQLLTRIAFAADDLDKQLDAYHAEANQLIEKFNHVSLHNIDMEQYRLRLMSLANNEHFLDSLKKLWNSPNRKIFLYVELGFFLFISLFKAWRQSKAQHWLGKWFVSIYCLVLLWGGMLFFIPYGAFGDAYLTILKSIWSIFA